MYSYPKHIGDFLKDTLTLTMAEEGAYSRLLDQYYQSEAPLPLNLKEVYKLARVDGTKEKQAVDKVLSKFFIKTDEGFVQKRAQEEIEKYWDSDEKEGAKKDNAAERQQRSRNRRKALFDALRSHGITPEYNTKTGELSRMLSRVTGSDNNESVTRDVTRDNTANQNHTPNSTTLIPNKELTPPLDDSQVVGAETPNSGGLVSPAEISKAMRHHGVDSQPSDPRIIAIAEQGVAVETVKFACQEAKRAKGDNERINVGYVVGILQRLAREAAGISVKGAKPTPQGNAATRDAGRSAAANSIGLGGYDHGSTGNATTIDAATGTII